MKSLAPLFASKKQDWQTPPHIFQAVHKVFNYDIDAAADKDNSMLPEFWTEEDNALEQDWSGKRIWCNPPYSKAKEFIAKAMRERFNADIITLLLPFRPDTIAFQSLSLCAIYAIKGRLKFVGADNSAPFPSCLIFLGKEYKVTNIEIPGMFYLTGRK
jgi:phage N-6-adenine-methyltransferase